MYRRSKLGHLLFDFLPEEDLLKSIKAMIKLFYERGDRTNRMKAKFRLLVEKLEIDGFKKLYFEYFNKENVQNPIIETSNYHPSILELTKFTNTNNIDEFKEWTDYCVKKTKFKDVVSLILYIKNGDLSQSKKTIKTF